MSSLGHQKMMKSEDVKIGNIIILQSRCYLGCGEFELPTLNILENIADGKTVFFYKKNPVSVRRRP